MIKKLMEKRDGARMNLQERILKVILIFCIAATSLATVAGPLIGLSGPVVTVMLFVLAVASFSMWIVCKYQKIELASCLMAGSVNVVMLPVIFFANGGLKGGAAVWFVFGIACVYLLFSGKHRTFFIIMSYISFYSNPMSFLEIYPVRPCIDSRHITGIPAVNHISSGNRNI